MPDFGSDDVRTGGIIKIDAGGPVVSDPILLNQLTSVR